ncbi:hypothetical protein C5Z25_00615 [Lactobacillus sp. CBA3605]|uniref:hypothetical protein n=1 Tax=Lactobacillus sp. CBA3605 TaxID=2099788 RepID=UPI000CFB2020|nr:hypothetical protein [Lactobacillus sp. CBA3605]AVK60368.1 hypothetical protein C5Z25_00615 [Lactobacillus sp. CBA3605]
MTKRLLVGLNWLAAGILCWAVGFAIFLPIHFFADQDWVSPVVSVLLVLGLILILSGLKAWINQWSVRAYRYWLWGLGGLIVIVQVWVAVHFVDASRADAFFVRNQALALVQGKSNWAEYFKVYPNNVNFTLLEAGLLKGVLALGLKTPWVLLNCLRFIWLDTGLIAGLSLLWHWQRWRPGAFGLMLTWLVSVPVYAYALFAYTDALVMPLIIDILALSWWWGTKTGWSRWLAGGTTWILLGLGVVMKSNMIVLWLAAVITLLVAGVQRHLSWQLVLKWLVGSIVILGLMSAGLSKLATQAGYQKDVNAAVPVTSWIAMSLNPKTNGQYNNADFTRVRRIPTQAGKQKMTQKMIRSRLKTLRPTGIAVHVIRKLRVFLATGDFDSFKLTTQWLREPGWYRQRQRTIQFWLVMVTQSWYLVLLIGSIGVLVTRSQHRLMVGFLVLTILGLTSFHVLLWEVEPRYALPLLPVVMLLGCLGWAHRPDRKLTLHRRQLYSGLAILGAGFSLWSIRQTSRSTSITGYSAARQGNGAYFTPNRRTLQPGQVLRVKLPVSVASNQLRLLPKSTHGLVTVKLQVGQQRLQRTGQPKQVAKMSYPTTPAATLTVTIINRGKLPVQYGSVQTQYSQQTGRILRQPQNSLQYSVAMTHAPTSLTGTKTIVGFVGTVLVFVLTRLWWRPRQVN